MIIMNDNSATADYKAESEPANLVPDDTQNTDFTQVACSVFKEEDVDQGSRKARSALINENIEEEQPATLRHFFSRLLGLK
jgi:hypothetical protein